MRAGLYFGRLCFRRGAAPRLSTTTTTPLPLRFNRSLHINQINHPYPRNKQSKGWNQVRRKGPVLGTVLFAAALTPGAFMELAEQNSENKTGEMQMLEASREEIRKAVSEDAHGLSRVGQEVYVFLYSYVYEPVATGIRFLHLAVIFLPLILTVPVIWIGRRNVERNNERLGTLWWIDFLVRSMERAGPAFIKVRYMSTISRLRSSLILAAARTMGRVANRYLSTGIMCPNVLSSFKCTRTFSPCYQEYIDQGL